MKRREAREQAFLLIFEMSFREDTLDEIVENATQCRDLETDEYMLNLVELAKKNKAEVDTIISNYSTKWKVDRLSAVSYALLRMAICEILYGEDIPVGVAINEAVELAKRYGGDEDAPFVNGVLGAFARDQAKSAE